MLSLTDAARRNATVIPERKRYSRIPEVLPIPDLIELQRGRPSCSCWPSPAFTTEQATFCARTSSRA